jgi:hypothetical protein
MRYKSSQNKLEKQRSSLVLLRLGKRCGNETTIPVILERASVWRDDFSWTSWRILTVHNQDLEIRHVFQLEVANSHGE